LALTRLANPFASLRASSAAQLLLRSQASRKEHAKMVKKEGIYNVCKAKVVDIQEAYDEFVNAIEEYKGILTKLIEECDPNDEQDKHLLVIANLQRNTTNGLINTLDTDIHDDLTRLSDRVIRFKHWEDGLFV
jgi:predicted RNA-binding protein with PUA domain